jgi:enoyl-CoA hydratase/carnithine racemase
MPSVLYEKRHQIAVITLNRPEKKNAIGFELADELKKVWIDFRDDDSLWVAIINGNGESFCAGADISRAREQSDPVTGKRRTLGLEVSPAAYDIWKPVIAAMHGYVLGAGWWLALGCDIRIAADNTLFGMPEGRWGRPVIFTLPLLREVPLNLVREVILTGNYIDAQRAYQGFLVNKVVPSDRLMLEANAWAEQVCEVAPLVARATKKAIQQGRDLNYGEMMAFSENLFEPLRDSHDFTEGRKAFAEKRKPQWKAT